MSVNFGYGGYGMGANSMGMNMMGNSMGGNNAFQSIANQYSCPTCYQSGVVPYNLKTNVNPLPQYAIHQTWFSRMIRRVFGG